MTASDFGRTLTEDLLARAAEDWVSAAEVIDLVRGSGVTDPEALRDLSIGLITRLMVQGLVVPGSVDEHNFVPWKCVAGEAVVRIATEWAARSDPFVMPGEIVWLDTTQDGQTKGEEIWEREGGRLRKHYTNRSE